MTSPVVSGLPLDAPAVGQFVAAGGSPLLRMGLPGRRAAAGGAARRGAGKTSVMDVTAAARQIAVIGVGNEYRHDGGVGWAVVAGLAQRGKHRPLPRVRVDSLPRACSQSCGTTATGQVAWWIAACATGPTRGARNG